MFKISQYKLSLYNLNRAADWKNGNWDQVEKLNHQVRSDMETRLLSWVPEFTYPNDWLAFLVCSFPIDHYTVRKLSLDGVVPALHPAVILQTAATSVKVTRRDERAAAASVPGTATQAAEDARLKRARNNDEVANNGGGVSEVIITMNHNINKNGSRPFSDQVFPDNNDDTIAGLRSQLDTTKQLIVNLQELGAEEYILEIKSYKLSIIQLLQEILELQKGEELVDEATQGKYPPSFFQLYSTERDGFNWSRCSQHENPFTTRASRAKNVCKPDHIPQQSFELNYFSNNSTAFDTH